mgnify:CR=1 FL=1
MYLENERARRAYEKLGFIVEGRLRDYHRSVDGRIRDALKEALSGSQRVVDIVKDLKTFSRHSAEERRGLTATHGYGLFSARLAASGLRVGAHGSVDVGLWGRNLADEEYPATAIDNLPQADRAVVWGEPRAFGLDLVYRYF